MGTALVIGGGPNGLAAAITLASKGHDVTVLEARAAVGGRTEILADTSTVQPWATKSLGLEIEWSETPEWRGADDEGLRPSAANLPAVTAWRGEVDRFAGLIRALSAAAPPNIRSDASLVSLIGPALHALKLGRADGLELARVGPLCAQDWLDEWSIPRDVQAPLIAPALLGTWMGPQSPTSALAVLFYAALSGQSVVGGMPALRRALVTKAQATGVTLQTGARVKSIRVDGTQATGVELSDGSHMDADVVLSTIGPKATLMRLVPARSLPIGEVATVQHVRTRGVVAVSTVQLESPVFGGAERVVLAADNVALERAFDDAKHRRAPRTPCLVVHQSEGEAVVHAFGVAHDRDDGWSEAGSEHLRARIVELLKPHGEDGAIGPVTMWTPADLEAEFGLDGGHLFHGEFAIDQFLSFRPHPKLSGYRTAIDGLVLGGAGMHPAGGFTLAQGVLAARQV